MPWNFKILQWINLNESFRPYNINFEDYVRRFEKNSFKSFQRYSIRRLKSKFWFKLHLHRWWENGLVFKIARTKIHQNFLATKYDIKQHSDAIFNYLKSKMSVIPLFSRIQGIIHQSTSNICVRDFSSNRDLSHNSNTIC